MDPNRLDRAADRNEEAARKFDAGSEGVTVETHTTEQRLLRLDAHWDGVAQSRFFENWNEDERKARRHVDYLGSIAAGLRGLGGQLRMRAHEERERQRREAEERWQEHLRQEREGGN